MNTYENEYEYIPAREKKSPFADSPYECACPGPQEQILEQPASGKAKKTRPVARAVIAAVVLVACCTGTAIGVTSVWRDRMDNMEKAMEEKFAALAQLYSEKQNNQSASQLPQQGPLTPSQVYEKAVKAVVAVHSPQGQGSGFVISADGYVVTNYHVIEGASQITVVTHDNQTLKAAVKGYDSGNDVALLKVEKDNMAFVSLGSSDALQVGDQVAAIGNPLGELTATLTVGYISAKDRVVSTDGSVINMLQTDAAINSGNSGGPLFNMNGEVVGITTAKYSGNSDSGASIEGLGFAIPVDDVAGILSDLKEFGYVTGGYLGVYVRDVDATAQSYGLPAGAYVEETVSGLAAAKAGVRAGDIIVNLGGYDVDSITSLTRALRRFKAGDSVSVTVYRGGQKVYLTVILGEKPVEEPQTSGGEGSSFEDIFGNWFDNLPPIFGDD